MSKKTDELKQRVKALIAKNAEIRSDLLDIKAELCGMDKPDRRYEMTEQIIDYLRIVQGRIKDYDVIVQADALLGATVITIKQRK